MTIQRGYGITPIAFDPGHVLALRVVQEPALRIQVWHRTPEPRRWTAYEGDGVTARWQGGPTVRVSVEELRLVWHLRLRGSPLARLANAHPSRIALELDGSPHAGWARLRVHGRPGPGEGGGEGPGSGGGGRPPGHEVGPAPGWREGSGPRSVGRTVVRPRRVFVVGTSRAALGEQHLGAPRFAAPGSLAGLLPWRAPGLLVEGEMRVEADGEAVPPVAETGWRSPPEAAAGILVASG